MKLEQHTEGALFGSVGDTPTEKPSHINLPNAISFAGYASGIAWLMGASPVWALVSIVSDEVDGAVARARHEETEYGALLDRAIDLTMAGAVAYRIDALWTLPFITAYQVYNQEAKNVVPFGSARTLMMAYALLKGK